MRLGFLLALGAGAAAASSFDFSLIDLARWDLRNVSGGAGDAVTSGIASAVGAMSLTPVGSVVLEDPAVGGRRALQTAHGSASYLRCDALATALATKLAGSQPFTLVIRYRAASITRDQPLVCLGNSGGGASNYLQIFQSQLGAIKIISNTTTGGTVTRTGTINTQLDEHLLTISSSGTVYTVTIDGATDTLDNSAVDTNAITLDRGAVGAILNSAFSSGMDGYVQWVGLASTVLTAPQIASLNTTMAASDLTLTLAARKQFAWTGDSLTNGNAGTGDGGFRKLIVQWAVDHALSINFVGHRNFGVMPLRGEFAQGGNALGTIASEFTTHLTGLSPWLVWFLGGTNNQTTQTTTQALTDSPNGYDAALAAIDAAAVAANANAKLIVTTIPAFNSAVVPTAAANEPGFNAALPGRWDTYDAAHPTRPLIRANIRTILGAYSAPNYVDETHPNDVGNQIIADGLIPVIGPAMRAISPTLVALTCTIKAPAASASLPYGTPVTISGRVSRYPSTVVVKLGSTTLGSATSSKRTWSYTWTPLVGDLGAQTLNAVVTDTLDSSTASATGVAVTVAAPAYLPSDEGNAILNLDVSDAAAITQGGGVATAIKNKISGISATEATNPPAYSATAGPGGNKPAITFTGASSQQLVSATDTTVGSGTTGDDHSFTWVGVVKATATSANGTWFGFGGSGNTASQFIGQITTGGSLRVFRNPDANTGAVNWQSTACPSGWMLLEVTFDGTAKTMTVRVNNGAASTVAYDTTTLTPNRWTLGREARVSTGTFGSFSFAEAWLFSDVQIGKASSGGKDAADRVYNYLNTKWGLGLAAR